MPYIGNTHTVLATKDGAFLADYYVIIMYSFMLDLILFCFSRTAALLMRQQAGYVQR